MGGGNYDLVLGLIWLRFFQPSQPPKNKNDIHRLISFHRAHGIRIHTL